MRVLRRVYLYTMAWTALVVLTAAVLALAAGVGATLVGLRWPRAFFARWTASAMVAAPMFFVHALWAERVALREETERHAGWRQVYTAAVAGLGVYVLARHAGMLVYDALTVLWQGEPLLPVVWWARWWGHVAALAWAALVLFYARRLWGTVGRPERLGTAARWRRLFVIAVGGVGLALAFWGTWRLLAALLLVGVPPVAANTGVLGRWWPSPVAARLATALVGWGLWRWAWQETRHWGERPWHPEDKHALSRQAFYYTGIALGLAGWLIALGEVLRWGWLWVLGEPRGPRHVWWPSLATAISALPVALLLWTVHRRAVVRAWGVREAPHFHLLVGRVYTYLASALGLAVAGWGAAVIVRTGTALWLWPPTTSMTPGWWRRPLATGLALLLIAGPTWVWHWRRIQDVVQREDVLGQAERASRLRRGYLYGVSLVAGLVVLVFMGQVLYRFWLWWWGEPIATLVAGLANALGPALVALAAWAYHLYTLRQDLRREEGLADIEERERLLAEREALKQRLAEIEAALRRLEEENKKRP